MPLGQKPCIPDDYISKDCQNSTCTAVFFDRGSAEIREDAAKLIHVLSVVLRNKNPQIVTFKSYSSNVADQFSDSRKEYRSLADNRLKMVVNFLAAEGYVPKEILSSVVQLRCLPDGGEGTARSKRVEIIWN